MAMVGGNFCMAGLRGKRERELLLGFVTCEFVTFFKYVFVCIYIFHSEKGVKESWTYDNMIF